MDSLDVIAQLSHEFGTETYICGGGGNTSTKNAETLWIKPSGTTLSGMTPESFVALERAKVSALYDAVPPEGTAEREAFVKDMMMGAVRPESSGRPSVESPVHEAFSAAFVVHTHPAIVNGLTCARDGKVRCAELFPDALWLPYTNPGYTLAMTMRRGIQAYAAAHACEPSVVMIQNHGVFVAGNTAGEIRETYARLMTRLRETYAAAGIEIELQTGDAPADSVVADIQARIGIAWGDEAEPCVLAAPPCPVAEGPLSPDHLVYMRAYPLLGDPTPAAVAAFVEAHGYRPSVIAPEAGIFAVGGSPKDTGLAMELAGDGARIRQFAEAFGGIHYMDEAARDFIENWEVEAYRRQVAIS